MSNPAPSPTHDAAIAEMQARLRHLMEAPGKPLCQRCWMFLALAALGSAAEATILGEEDRVRDRLIHLAACAMGGLEAVLSADTERDEGP